MHDARLNDRRWVEGAGDSLELLARAFATPTEEVAVALVSGALRSDGAFCAKDLGIAEAASGPLASLQALESESAAALFAEMRRAHSVLYMVPANEERIFPFEGAFRFVAAGNPGEPLVFSTRAAADMEKRMAAAGLQVDGSLHEPADSLWFELAFLSHLYGQLANALSRDEDVARLQEAIESFQEERARPWMGAFMDATIQRASKVKGARVYQFFAELGAVLTEAIF